jgi:hypothetical protein
MKPQEVEKLKATVQTRKQALDYFRTASLEKG